jgi:hypothetical protein
MRVHRRNLHPKKPSNSSAQVTRMLFSLSRGSYAPLWLGRLSTKEFRIELWLCRVRGPPPSTALAGAGGTGWTVSLTVNEFYKKGCQEKSSSSTGGREDFCLEIQPTDCKCPSIALEGFSSGLSALPVGFIFPW